MLASALAAAMLCANAPAQAQQFAAELISANAKGESGGGIGKVYAADGKVRIETSEFPDSFLLIDSTIPATYLVRVKSHVFMDSRQSSRLTRILVPLDPDDPCRQWEIMADVAGLPDHGGPWQCVRDGADAIDGRATIKFSVTTPSGRSTGWIDRDLRFPVKYQIEDGTAFVLRNIQPGPQDAGLFAIPANYKKFDPHKLLEWLKQSDVLVEPAR